MTTRVTSRAGRYRALAALVAAVSLVIGSIAHEPAGAQEAPDEFPPHPEDTVPSFAESPGCGTLNGVRGPLMGPADDPTYPYNALPDNARLHGPWGDYFGRDIGEVRESLVVVHLPGLAKDLYIHERVLPAFNQVLANLAEEAANGNVYEIRNDTWSFNPATIPPGRRLSFHGIGASIDVNSETNPYRADNVLITDMPTWFVDAWRDAGWCWGGDWVSIKDPMHFAWMGPTHPPDNGPDPAPYPANTAASSHDTVIGVPNAMEVTIPSTARTAIDVDRDGAPDVVRFQQSYQTGEFKIEAAEAWRRFETCTATQWAPAPPVTASRVLLGDRTSDGRPEVWIVDDTGATLDLAFYSIVAQVGGSTAITGVPQLLETVNTSIPVVAGAEYRVGDHDRDGEADLYVITPGATTSVEVWQGPGLGTLLVDQDVALATDATWRFDLGDHDLDVVPDLFALSADGPASLGIVTGGSGFTTAPIALPTSVTALPGEALSVEDYDGDGRDDLYLIGTAGSVRVVLGGVPPAGLDPQEWFVRSDLAWTFGSGCAGPAYLRVVTDPAVASQILIDGSPADTWGLNWLKVPPGDYTVSFRDREGFATPSAQVVAVPESATTVVTGSFSARGFLRVITDPAVPATISVDDVPRNDWGMWTDLAPGDYQVCFGAVADFTAPPCENATVTPGSTTVVTGTYTSDPGAGGPTDYGWLRVVTSPAVASQIVVDGVPRDTWGLNWLKVPPGDYTVSFRDIEGFATPAPQTVAVTAGTTTEVVGSFVRRGWLRAITDPPVPATIFVDGVPRNDWGMWTDLTPGDYEVCFGRVPSLTTPECQTATVEPGSTVTVVGHHGGPAPLGSIALDVEIAASGFTQPILATHRSGDPRLFVADQPGVIYAVDLGDASMVPILDITSLVGFTGERGLLGLAFHPADPDRMFVHYSALDGSTAVEEYSLGIGGVADPGSRRTILTHPQPDTNHNGGMIDFGPDGYLYVALGDGGGGNDPYANGQDPFTLLGAILRIDIDGDPYDIPPDNPFADGVAGAPEVWAWGLRNPWRFDFDGLDLWVGDVGQGAWEEIDLFRADRPGDNAGWPLLEGSHCNLANPCNFPEMLGPIVEYGHTGGRCSVTGGVVYRGGAVPALHGTYLYGDFCTGEIWGFRQDTGESALLTGGALQALNLLTTFGEGPNGEVYIAQTNGTVWRLIAG